MKTVIQSIYSAVVTAFACIALPQIAIAVVPAPDGCYPNYTTAEGCNALAFLTTGGGNTALGWRSLFSAGAANFNTGVGAGALLLNTGDSNTAVGAVALLLNTTGAQNTAVGTDALVYNNDGNLNNAVGFQALYSNTDGSGNNAFGYGALHNNTGSGNTAIGNAAGYFLTFGNGNVCIGSSVSGVDGESNTTRIKNIGSTPQASGIFVTVDAIDGTKLGYQSSSRRYKQDIKPMDNASETLLKLKPVTFYYKKDMDPDQVQRYGLIAEDVEKVDPGLVVHNPEGKPETLRFEAVNAMLLNEFLKEHKKNEVQAKTIAELKSTLAQQQRAIEQLATQMQKVSAQVQLNGAPTIAANP